jgi:hypothetical protein
METQKPLFAAQ